MIIIITTLLQFFFNSAGKDLPASISGLAASPIIETGRTLVPLL